MAISLALNLIGGSIIFVGGLAKPPAGIASANAGDRHAPHPPRPPQRVGTGDQPLDSSRLLQAGLTVEEARGVLVAAVNSRFRQEADDLMRIVDPVLTCDELHAEGKRRFALLAEAETRRRESIESITQMPWAEFEVQSGWSKRMLVYSFGVVMAGAKERMLSINAAMAAATSDAAFAKHDPFGLARGANVEAVNAVVNDTEARLKQLLPGTAYIEYFKPMLSNDVNDVWSMDERFGEKLTHDQESQILALLLPAHPLQQMVGYGGSQSGRTITPEALPRIRSIVGDTAFGNLLKFESPELPWSPGMHVEIFEIEERYKQDVDSGVQKEELLQSNRLQLAARLGSDFQKYAASSRGAWLKPELPR